ncbi:hypothetical protein IPM44_04255 [bacterium]|nr:MAG: hypothetical protein IPM44_04255 [bacterium]
MAKLPAGPSKNNTKKPMSTGVKIAIGVAGVVAFLFVGAIIAGIFAASTIFGFVRDNKIKVDEKSGSIEVTTQDGQGTFSSKAELPKNYPSDIPVYPGATVVYSVVKEGEGSNVTLQSADDVQKITAYYEEQLATQGWAKSEGQSSYFAMGVGFAEKTPRKLSFIVTQDTKEGKTMTVIVVTEKSS